ncbi:MAG: ethanolamine utilization protein EutJ [Spirochaetes bacterium GWD1_61_31]|nr:MAG: ethanolamine utilization protein EutJ [Spirochaetes bacterium GWB1_60_80]OHD34425.1 MAG: ethanolamine utilization protein EutJ [Spirochaetes bacterium GWC1_61_12]OHD36034.1 MAG: ethanolamine utilization protein EutJ [Spirochaetes bacterium GWD1_61_31]OHD42127.1 MAG: ethanolamine utilization protein EutJ [Spirochaetes bacterium GWE1_60_18]OHD59250.1 MAG: ethanolamine utilization protein EutJ [Spirochaetes bacterium GWF1_60_12]HAP43917.1 ethanolamine utilization protein EutJ [Spirochaeta
MSKRRILRVAVTALVVFAVLLASACEKKDGDSAAPAPTEVRIGIVAPITGDAATFGISTRNGAQLYFDQVNAAGGINGMTIRTFVEDDKGDPAEGANAWSKLIDQDKVVTIVGTVMSKVSLAGAPISQNKGIPMISPTSTNPAVTLVGDYVFRACFIDPFQGLVAAKYATQTMNVRRAAVLYDAGNDYTKGLAEVFRDEFIKMGGEIVAFESYATGTSDFNAQLVKINAVAPDVLFLPNYYNDVGLIAKQARAMGISAQFLGGDGWDSPDLFTIGGTAIEGGIFSNHFTAESTLPAAQAFVRDYEARYGQKPDALAALAYEAAMIVVDSIRRAGSIDPTAIRDAMATTNMETITGRITFDASRNPIKGAVLLEVRNGAAVYKATVNP